MSQSPGSPSQSLSYSPGSPPQSPRSLSITESRKSVTESRKSVKVSASFPSLTVQRVLQLQDLGDEPLLLFIIIQRVVPIQICSNRQRKPSAERCKMVKDVHKVQKRAQPTCFFSAGNVGNIPSIPPPPHPHSNRVNSTRAKEKVKQTEPPSSPASPSQIQC